MTINECFSSIQGEGKYMGVPVIFLRTQGCPVKCSFCFGPDSKGRYPVVLTTDGIYEPINTIEVGRTLFTDDGKGGLQSTTVTKVYTREVDASELYRICAGRNGNVLYATREHPFANQDRQWIKASELHTGDILIQVPDWKVYFYSLMLPENLQALHDYTNELLTHYDDYAGNSNTGDRNGNYNSEYTHHNFDRLVWLNKKGLLRDILTDEDSVVIHHLDHNHDNDDPSNLVVIGRAFHDRLHARGNNFGKALSPDNSLVRLSSVGKVHNRHGKVTVYNLETDTHTYVCNMLLVHNCDTKESWKNTDLEQTAYYILQDVARASHSGKIKTVVITGGEPMIQTDIYTIVQELRYAGYRVHLETSGYKEVSRGYFDHVVVSPKPNLNYRVPEGQVDELKYVIGEEDVKEINHIIPGNIRTQFDGRIWLQPKANGLEVPRASIEACNKLAMLDPRLRVGIQLHKYYGVK